MKKLLVVLAMLTALPVMAEEVVTEVVTPDQTIENEKGFAGVNYARQDNKQAGKQLISNKKSAFNINVVIIKEGALFKKDKDGDVVVGGEQQ